MDKIPFLDLKAQYKSIRGEVLPTLEAVCESTGFAQGPATKAFEQEFAQYCEAKHCVSLNSGTHRIVKRLAADTHVGRRPEPVKDAWLLRPAPVGARLHQLKVLVAAFVARETQNRHHLRFLAAALAAGLRPRPALRLGAERLADVRAGVGRGDGCWRAGVLGRADATGGSCRFRCTSVNRT